jgi:2,4'-dihydroxyacetophenone dioxygenase
MEKGCWVVLATFLPGAQLNVHYHTGVAEVYTLAGCWHYAEYPDQLHTAGSYLFEPAGSVHTFMTPETNTEGTCYFCVSRARTLTSPKTERSTQSLMRS